MSANIGTQSFSFFPPTHAPQTLAGMGDESVGARARAARKARGMTQVVVAATAKVDQSTISAMENDRWSVEEATLARVADALAVPFLWLRDGKGQGPQIAASTKSDSGVRRVTAPPAALAEAIETAFDKGRGHRIADVDAVRDAFAGVPVPGAASESDLAAAALRLLDSAASLRAEGQPVTLASISLRVAGIT